MCPGDLGWSDPGHRSGLNSLYSSHPISHPRSRDGKRFARDCSAGWGIPHPGKEFWLDHLLSVWIGRNKWVNLKLLCTDVVLRSFFLSKWLAMFMAAILAQDPCLTDLVNFWSHPPNPAMELGRSWERKGIDLDVWHCFSIGSGVDPNSRSVCPGDLGWSDPGHRSGLNSLYSSHPISHPRSRDGKRFARDCSAGWGIPHPGKEFWLIYIYIWIYTVFLKPTTCHICLIQQHVSHFTSRRSTGSTRGGKHKPWTHNFTHARRKVPWTFAILAKMVLALAASRSTTLVVKLNFHCRAKPVILGQSKAMIVGSRYFTLPAAQPLLVKPLVRTGIGTLEVPSWGISTILVKKRWKWRWMAGTIPLKMLKQPFKRWNSRSKSKLSRYGIWNDSIIIKSLVLNWHLKAYSTFCPIISILPTGGRSSIWEAGRKCGL